MQVSSSGTITASYTDNEDSTDTNASTTATVTVPPPATVAAATVSVGGGGIMGMFGSTGSTSSPASPVGYAGRGAGQASLPTLNEITTGLTNLIDNLFTPEINPTVPGELAGLPPASISARAWAFSPRWQLIDPRLVNAFVFAPLPKGITTLAEAFPELGNTLDRLGVKQLSDLERLAKADIYLPAVTDTDKLPENLVLASGLTPEFISRLPLATALSVSVQGDVSQVVNALSGSPITLSVRPDGPVNSVHGYLLLKESKFTENLSIPMSSQLAAIIMAATPRSSKSEVGSFSKVEDRLVLGTFDYADADHDGVWTAEITAPMVASIYEVLTVYDYQTGKKQQLRLTLVVDPEGYVYARESGNETRIKDASVTIYMKDVATGKFIIWPAKDYQQENPQSTGPTGEYSFLVPVGEYKLGVTHPDYDTSLSPPFAVSESKGVHTNVELTKDVGWWDGLDWKWVVMLAMFAFMWYHFRNDRRK